MIRRWRGREIANDNACIIPGRTGNSFTQKQLQRSHAQPGAESLPDQGSKAAKAMLAVDNATSTRTRVLVVCSTLHIGGAEGVAACLAEHTDRDRFELTACYLKENGVVGESMLAHGVDLVPIPGHAPGRRDRFTSLKLLRLIRQRRIQVVHTHDVHGLMDATICRRLIPRLRHVHTFHFGNYPRRDRSSARFERLCWRSPDALVAVGYAQADAIRSLYGMDTKRLRVIWNGVADPAPMPIDETLQSIQEDGRPIVLSISTLIQQKGLPHLIDAAKILKDDGLDFCLVIVGHGELRQALERRVAELGLADAVKFLGWVPDAARRVLPTCDVFVQSSLWEAMSIVVLEAMAGAKPMVVTRVGENAHAVDDGVTGLLVPPGDAAALAAAIGSLLRDPAAASQLGVNARNRYLAHFTLQPMIAEYESLYSELARTIGSARA